MHMPEDEHADQGSATVHKSFLFEPSAHRVPLVPSKHCDQFKPHKRTSVPTQDCSNESSKLSKIGYIKSGLSRRWH